MYEHQLKRREVEIKDRELQLRREELHIKQAEHARSKWTNPLVVAILAAGLAGLGNAVVVFINGVQQREQARAKQETDIQLEKLKSEYGRVLETLKTTDHERTLASLRFLLETGLVTDSKLATNIAVYLRRKQPNAPPSLPATDIEPGKAYLGDRLRFRFKIQLQTLHDRDAAVCLPAMTDLKVVGTEGSGSEMVLIVKVKADAQTCGGQGITQSTLMLLPLALLRGTPPERE